jgi:hypothetical protein
VSWDQHASHAVLEKWVGEAMRSDHVSGIGWVGSTNPGCFVYTNPENAAVLREAFVKDRINQVDSLYGRTLGCRVSPLLKQFMHQDNHLRKHAKLEAERQLQAEKEDGGQLCTAEADGAYPMIAPSTGRSE